MGISGFFYHLKNLMKPSKKEFAKVNDKKYDFLILDYHSLFHNVKNLYDEINYFIRILFEVKYQYECNIDYLFGPTKKGYMVKNNLCKQLEYIITTYKNIFDLIGINLTHVNFRYNNIRDSLKKINFILDKFPLSEDIIKRGMIADLVLHTENLARKYTHSHATTLIYFDGVPSVSKIKEQLNRRIFLTVSKLINADISKFVLDGSVSAYNPSAPILPKRTSEHLIRRKLIINIPPINLNEPIINETRDILAAKGFTINDKLRYGEAEHQIMKDLRDAKYKDKNILLASPDADLILLSMLALVFNGVKIDIYRESILSPSNFEFKWNYITPPPSFAMKSPFGRDIVFININDIIKLLGLTTNQKILDIVYLFLLLGDDFIPVISTLDVKALTTIITTYDEIKLPIVSADAIIYANLITFIDELSKQEDILFVAMKKKFNSKIGNKTDNASDNYQKSLALFQAQDNLPLKKIIYLDNGLIINDDGSEEILAKAFVDPPALSEGNIGLYLQGYQFIFDLYYLNNLKNYKWYYPHDTAPTLKEIVTFLKAKTPEELPVIFDYTHTIDIKTDLNYFDLATYKKYIDDNKDKILRNIIANIVRETREAITFDPATVALTPALLSKYFTYKNIKIIYKCFNGLYLQSCLDYDSHLIDPDDATYNTKIRPELLGGYYQKYLKYKNKYLKLKNELR